MFLQISLGVSVPVREPYGELPIPRKELKRGWRQSIQQPTARDVVHFQGQDGIL